MNDIINAMETRRSVRNYKPDMIPEETIRKICEAGTYAASGKGNQSPIIIAVTDKALRDKLSRMNAKIMGTDIDPFYGAPVVLVVLADRKFPTYIYDGSLVIGNLMLAAHSEGIGSCWIHRAKEEFQSEKATTKVSVTACWDMSTVHSLRPHPERKTTFTTCNFRFPYIKQQPRQTPDAAVIV